MSRIDLFRDLFSLKVYDNVLFLKIRLDKKFEICHAEIEEGLESEI